MRACNSRTPLSTQTVDAQPTHAALTWESSPAVQMCALLCGAQDSALTGAWCRCSSAIGSVGYLQQHTMQHLNVRSEAAAHANALHTCTKSAYVITSTTTAQCLMPM